MRFTGLKPLCAMNKPEKGDPEKGPGTDTQTVSVTDATPTELQNASFFPLNIFPPAIKTIVVT